MRGKASGAPTVRQSLYKLATFGGGCFWCTESIFKALKGVIKVTSGYAGGLVERPSYAQVCAGATGHAEVVQIEFDPASITYEQLVEVFFLTHDPTQLNRQGNDIGEQYRSVIFSHDDEQRSTAERVKGRLESESVYDRPMVTAIVPFENFFPAEAEHQDYYAKNPMKPYCQAVISPKLAEFRAKFRHLLRAG